MKVATRYSKTKRPGTKLERPGTKKMVETAGYRSTKTRVEEFLDAGRRLQEYRNLKYDFEPGQEVPDDFEDKTRRPGYDPADATQDLRAASARLEQSAKTKKDKAQALKEEASKLAESQETNTTPQDTPPE